MPITRRQFVKHSSAAVSLPRVVPSAVFGAHDKLRVAVVGLGGRGAQTGEVKGLASARQKRFLFLFRFER